MATPFTPTPAELALVNQIFAQADKQKIGILTGDVAVRVFGGAKLSPTVLGEIWNIADEDNNGFLTRKGVALAVRLIGWGQKGEKISQTLLSKPGPLANIEGVHASPPLVPQGTGMSIPRSPPPGPPPLTPQDKTKFARLFQASGPVNGLLSGDKARDVFFKSKLPVDKLSQIWTLADTQERGVLDLIDFTIAMYLIQAAMSNQLPFVPTSLPPGLYEQAGGALVAAHATGSSAQPASPATTSFPQAPAKQPSLQTNHTGQPAPVTQTSIPPAGPHATGTGAWDVTPVEKASADQFFDTLDSHKRGYIEGDVAVPFMLQSKLPEDVLAQVWDLADVNHDGRLTQDGFAIAIHLIQGRLLGKEVPAVLPHTLVPPSMRSNGLASPFVMSPPQPPEPIRDLLWDDSPPTSTVNMQSQHNIFQRQSTGIPPSTISPPPAPRATKAPVDPFSSAAPNSFHRDLLGDDDDTHTPAHLHDQSAEIGNLQNQVNSTNRSLENAKSERDGLEATLANQATQLSALQTQLASAKASFETETSLLNALKERHANQSAEIQKVREELIHSESELSAIRVEKTEIEGAFLRDKEEVRDLNRRMTEVAGQIAVAKQEVDKAKKDAKQQKGLLAIARKQLASKESDKAKVDQELGEAREELASAVKEREEVEEEADKVVASPQPLRSEPARAKSPVDSLVFAATQPLPVTPDITGGGPMSPVSKSNNPFERLAMSSGASTPRSQSPFRSFTTTSSLPPSFPPPLGPAPPAPDVAAATLLDDPFGVSQPFDVEPQVKPDTDAGVSTPKMRTMPGDFGEVMLSPTEELFSTPPNGTSSSVATPQFPSLDTAAAHFPALDDVPTGQGEEKDKETDLSADLHELDADDSDSDEDSEEEEDREGTQAQPGPSKDESRPPSSFEDVFGAAASGAPAATAPQIDHVSPTQNGSAALDAFGVPLTKPAATSEDSQDSGFMFVNAPAKNVASIESSAISSFDDAFGKPTTSVGQTVSNFSFDSAFEDNFDFSSSDAPAVNGSAVAAKQEVVAPGAQGAFSLPVNGGSSPAAPQAPPTQPPVPFDDAYWLAPSVQTNTPQLDRVESTPSALGSISFEEAFGGMDTSQALKLDNSFSSQRTSNTFAPSASPPQSSEAGKQFPAVSPPTSPRGPVSPRMNASMRSNSPAPRTASPAPRDGSPKAQRPSTSSSKEVPHDKHEKPAPPPRHSKLSLRLPFGRKKRQETMPPLPARVEQPAPGEVTPAVDDDVEPVKQLAAMGFSRNQAVAALEAHDYDVPRALNRLLGQQ